MKIKFTLFLFLAVFICNSCASRKEMKQQDFDVVEMNIDVTSVFFRQNF